MLGLKGIAQLAIPVLVQFLRRKLGGQSQTVLELVVFQVREYDGSQSVPEVVLLPPKLAKVLVLRIDFSLVPP